MKIENLERASRINDEVNTCIDNHIAELESEIETL